MTDMEDEINDLYETAAAKRVRLSADWPTAAQVGMAMGIDADDASQFVTEFRKQGALLGVYMTEPRHHWRYPTWQFDQSHRPIERLAGILAILRKYGNYLDDQGRTTGWGEVEWFRSAHVLLDDRPPYEVVQEDPDAVLDAARAEYVKDSNEGGF